MCRHGLDASHCGKKPIGRVLESSALSAPPDFTFYLGKRWFLWWIFSRFLCRRWSIKLEPTWIVFLLSFHRKRGNNILDHKKYWYLSELKILKNWPAYSSGKSGNCEDRWSNDIKSGRWNFQHSLSISYPLAQPRNLMLIIIIFNRLTSTKSLANADYMLAI